MKTILKRRRIFSGKLIKLELQRQRFPGGYIGDLEIVKHPGAVLVVPFLGRDKVILIKQYRPVIKAYIWELPAGTLNKNENPLKCAKRELQEEIGYRAISWRRMGFVFPAPGYTTEKILIFKACGLKKAQSDQQEDELIVPTPLTKKRIKRLFSHGRIVDAKTICALKLANIL